MPNHVTNIVYAPQHVLNGFIRGRTDEETQEALNTYDRILKWNEENGRDYRPDPVDPDFRFVDFGMVIPEPEDIFKDGCNMQHPHLHEDGTPYAACWSEWNRNAWGTKWNAYSTEIDDREQVQFDTAWSHPFPVIAALSKMFPDEEIRVEYADEDLGHNVGTYRIVNGEILSGGEVEGGSDEANELASQILYGKTYAEVRADWDQDEINTARKAMFCKRIETERGIDNGYKVIRDENLSVPQDIIDAICTVEDAKNYWKNSADV